MNPLKQLINEALKQQSTSLSELADRLDFKNCNKFIRRLNTALTELIDPNQLIQQVTDELDISSYLIHAAISDVSNALIEKQKLEFKPSAKIIYSKKLNMITAWGRQLAGRQLAGRHLAFEPFRLIPGSTVTQQFKIANGFFEQYKNRFSDTKGYVFHRRFNESYTFNNDGQLKSINRHNNEL